VNPSQLRNRITFQEYGEVSDADGFPVDLWNDVVSVWSAIKTPKGKEFYQANADQNSISYRFIIRYRKGLHPDMRVMYDGRFFEIEAILPDDELKKTLTVIAKEMV
jgi:SPP1 family predicted phage head-tail adaptor